MVNTPSPEGIGQRGTARPPWRCHTAWGWYPYRCQFFTIMLVAAMR